MAVLALALGVGAESLPSCEDDTSKFCLDGEDLSSEGIANCLKALDSSLRSAGCSTYLAMMDSCETELAYGGVCNDAHMNGEAVPCLIQRVSPDQLSASCQAALPEKEEAKGLHKKFWADGKRMLEASELAELNADDKDTYQRWLKKKNKPKSGKDKEREYAVKTQKMEKAKKAISDAAEAAALKAIASGLKKSELTMEVQVAVREAAQEAVAEDMTGTLKPFSTKEIAEMAKDAIKAAKKASKTEL